MATFGTDVNIFESYYAPSEIRDIFDERNVVACWLMFEGVLAEVQGELGLIPPEIAKQIKDKANLSSVDFDRVVKLYNHTKHPGSAVVQALSEVCENGAGEWVHYGSSSPELWENVLAYQIKKIYAEFGSALLTIRAALNQLADAHRHDVMLERSLGRHALPTTFGFVAAVWSNAITQHLQRFEESKPRVLTGYLKGVVGTYASYYKIAGDGCLELEKRVLDRLGLFSSDISFSRHLERFTEFMNLLLLLAQTFEKIFNDIFFQQREEIGELEEPYDQSGPSGSSSLPQKRNPVLCLYILARCKKIRSNAAAFGSTQVQQSHDTTAFSMENLIIPESCILMGDVLHNAAYVLRNLVVHPNAMRQNLKKADGLVMTESLVLGLAKKTGEKRAAHSMVRRAVLESFEREIPFTTYILDYQPILKHLSRDEIKALLEPENHLGLVDRCVDKVINNSQPG